MVQILLLRSSTGLHEMLNIYDNYYKEPLGRYMHPGNYMACAMSSNTCVVSSCVLYPLCVLYVFKNVGNNIKCGKKT